MQIKLDLREFNVSLEQRDTLKQLAAELKTIKEQTPIIKDIVARGGFILDTILGAKPNDIDLFYSLKTWQSPAWQGCKCDEIKKKIDRLDDPNDKLKAVFSLVVRMFKKNRHLAELFMVDVKQSSIFLTNYTINRIVEFLDLIEDILEEGKRKGIYRKDLDSRVAKMVIFGAAQGILLSWVLSESKAVRNQTFKFSLYRAAKTLKDIFKSGLVGERK